MVVDSETRDRAERRRRQLVAHKEARAEELAMVGADDLLDLREAVSKLPGLVEDLHRSVHESLREGLPEQVQPVLDGVAAQLATISRTLSDLKKVLGDEAAKNDELRNRERASLDNLDAYIKRWT